MIVADQANIDLVHKANALGGSTATARSRPRASWSRTAPCCRRCRGQLAAARHALALLVGHAPADWTAPDFTLADLNLAAPVPVALPSALVRKRPDILAAEADLHAATADIGVATADLYPNIKLTASLTQGSLKPQDDLLYDATAWNVGAGLTAPIFNGGALKARRQQAREAAVASSARYQQTVLTAFVQVADALSALSADDAAIAAYGRSEPRRRSLRLARVAYDKGGGTLLEVLDAQRRVHEIEASRVRAQGQRLADAVRLFAASGADWRAGREVLRPDADQLGSEDAVRSQSAGHDPEHVAVGQRNDRAQQLPRLAAREGDHRLANQWDAGGIAQPLTYGLRVEDLHGRLWNGEVGRKSTRVSARLKARPAW
jgi:NodT family efflux transporter outer membrane factor (OMF) lipoprotein